MSSDRPYDVISPEFVAAMGGCTVDSTVLSAPGIPWTRLAEQRLGVRVSG